MPDPVAFCCQTDSWRAWTTANGLGGNRISSMLVNSNEVWTSSYDIPYQYIDMRLSKIDKASGTAVSFPGYSLAGKAIGENEQYALCLEEGGYACYLFGKTEKQLDNAQLYGIFRIHKNTIAEPRNSALQ